MTVDELDEMLAENRVRLGKLTTSMSDLRAPEPPLAKVLPFKPRPA